MGDSAYSFSLTTFSRTGKLLPIEYALNAVANGRACLGICATNGVVLCTDTKLPPLVETKHVHKVEAITKTAGLCFAGVGPDYRVLVASGRKVAAAYERTYGEVMPVHMIAKSLASTMQEYTQRGGVRPFGVSLLLAGLDHDQVTPALYQIDPSGTYVQYKAASIGKNHVSAKSFLEKRWSPEMELEDAIQIALLTLREGFEGEMTATNIQVGVAKNDGTFSVLTSEQIQDYLDEAN